MESRGFTAWARKCIGTLIIIALLPHGTEPPNAMNGKIFRCYLMFCVLAGSAAAAGNVAYQSGKLIQIARNVPHVAPKGKFRGFPTYTFQIQVQNHVYVGSCVVLKKFEP